MGGIAGMVSYGTDARQQEEALRAAQRVLQRRGPDGGGLHSMPRAGFVQTRLRVADPEGDGQPFTAVFGGTAYVVVYDGEIFNADELRATLASMGHHCTTRRGAELLLHAYRAWGEHCVDKLAGMYAFAVWDGAQLFMARDRMGIRPLFYCEADEGLVFASTLPALLCHPWAPATIGREGIAEIWLLGPARTPGNALFSRARALKPGECATYTENNGLTPRTYWKPVPQPHPHTFDETVEAIRALLTRVIQRQAQAPGRVRAFLSGGVDSSSIAALSRVTDTFSVDYAGNDQFFTPNAFQPDGDNAYIDRMTAFLGTNHHRILLDTDALAGALGEAVEARGLPGMADVDASLLLFCRQVREQTDVALSGEAADEVFGGYPWYQDEQRLWEDNFPWARSMSRRIPFMPPDMGSPAEWEAYAHSRYQETVDSADGLPDDTPLERRIRQMFMLNLCWFGQTLLERHDRMSMHSGLEIRVPYCDHHLAEYLYNVPWAYKNHRGREKGLLREAMQGILPDEVLWRKKSPYPKTHDPAYLEQVTALLRDVLNSPNAPLWDITERSVAAALLDGGADDSTPWYGQLMTRPQTIAYLWQVNAWMERFRVRVE